MGNELKHSFHYVRMRAAAERNMCTHFTYNVMHDFRLHSKRVHSDTLAAHLLRYYCGRLLCGIFTCKFCANNVDYVRSDSEFRHWIVLNKQKYRTIRWPFPPHEHTYINSFSSLSPPYTHTHYLAFDIGNGIRGSAVSALHSTFGLINGPSKVFRRKAVDGGPVCT